MIIWSEIGKEQYIFLDGIVDYSHVYNFKYLSVETYIQPWLFDPRLGKNSTFFWMGLVDYSHVYNFKYLSVETISFLKIMKNTRKPI